MFGSGQRQQHVKAVIVALAVVVFLLLVWGINWRGSSSVDAVAHEAWRDVWVRKGAPATAPRSVEDLIRIDGFDHADDYLKIMEASAPRATASAAALRQF